ncbi:Alkanal monooxygenase alpha chain [Mycetocola reblochoni REB411]|uniref:Alkanal monooxygenase alpha chain n=1 Tax=Mycetocola reblochoni REB411 TaxID=1255698 RepID=A0A1R4JVY8_9MICO|nr:Alkanal monooxygenase alpha chain [Mycetocola reblochoni REB411]
MSTGILAFVEHGRAAGARSRALEDGLALVQLAEDLGYDRAFVRARHLEDYLSSPLTFLAAAAQRSERIGLGTAVIPLRYEDPIRLAEDAATVDLLSGGRLHLGFSSGYAQNEAVFAPVYGAIDRPFAAEAEHRLRRFLAAVEGTPVTTADEHTGFAAAGTPLRVTPDAPGLAGRVSYGAGRLASAARAGELGVHLQLSTLSTGRDDGGFEAGQLAQIRAYRAARAEVTDVPGHVSVSRMILPILDASDAEALAPLLDRDAERQRAEHSDAPPSMQFGRVHAGDPDAIVAGLLADPALAEADELILALPFGHGDTTVRRMMRAVAVEVLPGLRR